MNITGRARAAPRRRLLDLRVHAQAAGPRLLARPEPAGRPVPVQPAHRAGRDRRQPRRLAARARSARLVDRSHPQPRPGHHPDRDRRVHPDDHRLPQPVRARPSCSSSASSSGVVFLFAGFLVSIEVFREIRVPFTRIRLVDAAPRAPGGADRGCEAMGERAGPERPTHDRPPSTLVAAPPARRTTHWSAGRSPGSDLRLAVPEPTAPETRIRVLLVDDHAVVRRGLRGFLELLDDIDVVARGRGRPGTVVEAVRPTPPRRRADGPGACPSPRRHRRDRRHQGGPARRPRSSRSPRFIEEDKVTAALEAGAVGLPAQGCRGRRRGRRDPGGATRRRGPPRPGRRSAAGATDAGAPRARRRSSR